MYGLGRPQTVAEPQRLGKAAVLAMLRAAHHRTGAVLDSTWFDYAPPLARTLPGQLIEVHCTVLLDLAKAPYQARADGGSAAAARQGRRARDAARRPSLHRGSAPQHVV